MLVCIVCPCASRLEETCSRRAVVKVIVVAGIVVAWIRIVGGCGRSSVGEVAVHGRGSAPRMVGHVLRCPELLEESSVVVGGLGSSGLGAEASSMNIFRTHATRRPSRGLVAQPMSLHWICVCGPGAVLASLPCATRSSSHALRFVVASLSVGRWPACGRAPGGQGELRLMLGTGLACSEAGVCYRGAGCLPWACTEQAQSALVSLDFRCRAHEHVTGPPRPSESS